LRFSGTKDFHRSTARADGFCCSSGGFGSGARICNGAGRRLIEWSEERDRCEDDVSEDWEMRSASNEDLSELEGWEDMRWEDRADTGGSAGRGLDGAGKGLFVPGM
jgi:hypothetical protein